MLLGFFRYLRQRLFTWLSISGISLIFYALESILHPDDDVETIDIMNIANDTNVPITTNELPSSWIENMSTFIPSVIGLFFALFILWKIAVLILFGDINISEQAPLSKSLFRFVIFRFIILSGSINPARLTNLFGWLVWFTMLGFLHTLLSVFTSRCNQLSAAGFVSPRQWFRMLLSFLVIFVGDWALLIGGLDNCFVLSNIDVASKTDLNGLPNRKSFITGFTTPTVLSALKSKFTGKKQIYDTVDVVGLLVAEFALVLCPVVHLACGLLIQVYDRWCLSRGRGWAYQPAITSYLEFIFVCLYRIIEITHYLHLMLWNRVFSVASLVVFLHIRASYSSLTNCISRYIAQRRLSKYITENYQLCTATDSDVDYKREFKFQPSTETDDPKSENIFRRKQSDTQFICAICWDTMTSWRRLPCRHDFHEHCLRSWLEQNPSCPTCRRNLDVPEVVFGVHNRPPRHENNMALGLMVRNLSNSIGVDNTINQTNRNDGDITEVRTFPQSNNVSGISRLFTLGLNLGLSIGNTHVVTTASQTTTVNTSPNNSVTSTNSDDASNSLIQSTNSPVVIESASTDTGTRQNTNDNNNDRVTRRSFYFDGSRYFSWLPFLHVELSEVFREVLHIGGPHDFGSNNDPSLLAINSDPTNLSNANNINTTTIPPNLQVAVEQLTEMFPQFPRAVIISELLATGVPEVAAENLIARPSLPTPDLPYTANTSTEVMDNITVASPSDSHINYRSRDVHDIPSILHTSDESLNGVEEVDPEDNSFAARRKLMLSRARRTFMLKHPN